MTRVKPAPRVSVVVPCYNEGESISALAGKIEEVFRHLPEYPYECLFVNDGSTDNTREQLRLLSFENSCVRPLHLADNMGQSAALVAGMRSARGEYILTLDGDLQNDPSDFPQFLELLNDYDCVCGYRANRKDSWLRGFTSKAGNVVCDCLLKNGIRDTGCGMKGFRRICVEVIVPFDGVHRLFAVLIRNAGLTIVETPVHHHPRMHGRSKYGIANRIWRVLFDLGGVAWLRKRLLYLHVEEESPSGHDTD